MGRSRGAAKAENDALDWNVLAAIKANKKLPLRAGTIHLRLGGAKPGTSTADARGIDRSLQRLRKSKQIRLVYGPGGGWVCSDAEEKSHAPPARKPTRKPTRKPKLKT